MYAIFTYIVAFDKAPLYRECEPYIVFCEGFDKVSAVSLKLLKPHPLQISIELIQGLI
jgi:hypothetical protein